MALRNTVISYGSVSKFLHWAIFLLVLLMLIVGFTMGNISNDSVKSQVYNLHKLTGLLVLTLMTLRAVWALINPKPKLPDKTGRAERALTYTTHVSLYILLIAMPLSGWVMSSAAGHFPSFFGLASIPFPVEKSKVTAALFGQAHQVLAWLIISFVALHVLGALKHHFINKDSILRRMLPGKAEAKRRRAGF